MKKLSVFFLALLLTVFSACGDNAASSSDNDSLSNPNSTQTHPFSVEFEDVKDGIIRHFNHSTSQISAKEGFKSMDDFYLLLPLGTVIKCDKEFFVYCYNDSFALDIGTMAASGAAMDKMTPLAVESPVVLAKTCFVRFSVKGEPSDISIEIPKDSDVVPCFGNKQTLINRPTIISVAEKLDGRQNAVNYIFITDIHFGSDPESETGKLLLSQVKTAVDMANSIDSIDFIAIGGDTTTGMYETKSDAIKYTSMALEPLKECKKPVLVLMGNHDDNSYHRFTYDVYYPERILSDKDWNDNILKVFCPDDIVKDTEYANSKYYYYDLPNKKTRIICLDALDYRAEFDSKGNIAELPIKDPSATNHNAKYWSGTSWWGYSEEQLAWLTREAMTAGNDWDYIFLSHMGIDTKTGCYGYATKGGSELREILQNFSARKADFKNNTGKILAYQFGHIHAELTYFDAELGLWKISTATANPAQNSTSALEESNITDKTLGWNILNRAEKAESKMCFDIVSADRCRVLKFAYGAGNDKTMEY